MPLPGRDHDLLPTHPGPRGTVNLTELPSLRSVHDLAKNRFELAARLFLILAGDPFHEIFGLMMRYEIDGRAAKTAAGQARAQAAGMSAGEFHQQVQLG